MFCDACLRCSGSSSSSTSNSSGSSTSSSSSGEDSGDSAKHATIGGQKVRVRAKEGARLKRPKAKAKPVARRKRKLLSESSVSSQQQPPRTKRREREEEESSSVEDEDDDEEAEIGGHVLKSRIGTRTDTDKLIAKILCRWVGEHYFRVAQLCRECQQENGSCRTKECPWSWFSFAEVLPLSLLFMSIDTLLSLSRWWYVLPPWPPTDFDFDAALRERKLEVVSLEEWEQLDDINEHGITKVYPISYYPGNIET